MTKLKIKAITHFIHEYSFLSNNYQSNLLYGGRPFPTATHAFEASKTTNGLVREQIARATLDELDEISFRIITRPHWTAIEAMKDILEIKFGLCRLGTDDYKETMRLFKLLSQTGAAKIIFTNKYHDNFWGQCECGDQSRCDPTKARNYLGNILEATRTKVHQKIKQLNAIKKCSCGNASSQQVLFSVEWIPYINYFCAKKECMDAAIKDALKRSSDNIILDYNPNVVSKIVYLPTEKEMKEVKETVDAEILDDEDIMDIYGYGENGVYRGGGGGPHFGWSMVPVVKPVERKYETVVIQC